MAEGVEQGAARAHAYTRHPKAWAPTVAHLLDGSESAVVDDLMNAQRDKYIKYWKPACGPFSYRWNTEDADSELPMLEVAALREAAGSFRTGTSMTYDGFHPRQLASLGDEALLTLAIIFAAVERSAVWPRQVSMIVAALLPKPSGGYRPIGMAPAIYRLWAKARRAEADAWERRHPRPFFSATKGNGPADSIWRLAAQQEARVADGHVAATVSEDVQAFFETLDRGRLLREARALGFPVPIVKAALAAYSNARVISMSGRTARECYPSVGIVAGCSLAMALTKVYSLRAMDDLVEKIPKGVKLDTFVDDLTLASTGPPAAVIDDLTAAHQLMVDMVNEQMECSLAEDKTAISATTRNVAAAIARRLRLPGGTRAAATLLGIDCTAAARRGTLRGGSRKAARLKAAMTRRRRLKQLQKVIGKRAKKIYIAGVQPAAAYGGQVWGLDDGEVVKLRRLAAAALKPSGRCRSLQATLLWHDLPTVDAEHAPILQLSRMVWRAVAEREDAISRGSSVSDLRQWWESAAAQFGPLVQ